MLKLYGTEADDALEAVTKGVADTRITFPSYAPQTAGESYNPALNVYNLKPSNTRKLRKGLGKAATNQISEIVVIGDSSVTGAVTATGPVFERLRAWPLTMRDHLGVPVGGTGQVRINDGNYVEPLWWATTGTWNHANLGYSYATVTTATATFTTPLAGDRVTVYYYDDNSGATWKATINGVDQTTVTNNAGLGWKKITYSVPHLAPKQKVVLTYVTGSTYFAFSGVNVWKSNGGLLVHNIGQGGSWASGTATNRWQDASGIATLGQVYASPTSSLTDPDCVMIALGANDVVNAVSVATIKTALTTIRNRYSSSDCILVASNKLRDTLISVVNWEAFLLGMYELADTLDVPLIDFTARLGMFSVVEANGLHGDADGHLKVEAQVDEGRNAAQVLGSTNLPVLTGPGRGAIPSAAQALTNATDNLIVGTSIPLTTGSLKVGSRFKWEVGLIKTTAAGTGAWTIEVKFGTANTASDANIALWTSGTNTGAIDQQKITIEMEVLTLGAAATARCIAISSNTLTNATGLGRLEFAPGSTATFNSDAVSPYLHIDINPSTTGTPVMTAVGTAMQLVA